MRCRSICVFLVKKLVPTIYSWCYCLLEGGIIKTSFSIQKMFSPSHDHNIQNKSNSIMSTSSINSSPVPLDKKTSTESSCIEASSSASTVSAVEANDRVPQVYFSSFNYSFWYWSQWLLSLEEQQRYADWKYTWSSSIGYRCREFFNEYYQTQKKTSINHSRNYYITRSHLQLSRMTSSKCRLRLDFRPLHLLWNRRYVKC